MGDYSYVQSSIHNFEFLILKFELDMLIMDKNIRDIVVVYYQY